MTFGFIAKHRSIWPLAWLCKALGVSRSGFHAWLAGKPSARTRTHEALVPATWSSFTASDRTYGARGVWRDVLETGASCGLRKVLAEPGYARRHLTACRICPFGRPWVRRHLPRAG